MVLLWHNSPQPTQVELMKGEFHETLCIEKGVVPSCRFAEWTVRWTSRVLWMVVVSQSSEKSSWQENREVPCREQHTIAQVSPKSHQPLLLLFTTIIIALSVKSKIGILKIKLR